ncbi:hypothetical protein TWF718_007267 [Orbilia javanica]|uniref:Clr5 domain-containing protein n=1 Tax=Orbilia javanica TaxID=47235 RepID=A0AAN8MP68_9PEZI
MDSRTSCVSKRRNLPLSGIDGHVKDEIRFLYCVQDHTLKWIAEYINKTYGLNGKLHQYRDRLAAWGFRKNIRKAEWMNVQRNVLQRERMGKKSDVHVCLNEITIIPEKKVKRSLARHITTTDMIFMKAQTPSVGQMLGTAPMENIVEILSPSYWDDMMIPPIRRKLNTIFLENLPIKITHRILLETLLPMVSQHPEGSLQVSTIDANKYFVFLKTLVYSISNGLVHFKGIENDLSLINEHGYRRPFKALLSQKIISIRATCEKLMPIFYYRSDEEFIQHTWQHQFGSISYFSIISDLLQKLGGHQLGRGAEKDELKSWPGIRTPLHLVYEDIHRPESPYQVCLRRVIREIIERGVQPTSLPEAKILFLLCYDLKDFAPFFKATPQNLISALADQYSEQRVKTLLYIEDLTQIQLLIDGGFKLDYGFEERLLGVLVLEDDQRTEEFWCNLCVRRWPPVGIDQTNDRYCEEEESMGFNYIFDAARDIYQQNGTRDYYCVVRVYSDIVDDLQKNNLPEVALWEILLAGHLISLRPGVLDFFLEFLDEKYPGVEFKTYLFHTILRMKYDPEEYLREHYGSRIYFDAAFYRLLALGLDINLKLDSLVSPILYVIWRCSQAPGYPNDFESQSKVLDMLAEAGADVNAPLPISLSEITEYIPNQDYRCLRPIDIAYWGNSKEYFHYFLSNEDVGLEGFPIKPMVSKASWVLCPVFIQAAYSRNIHYVSENWGSRMRQTDGSPVGLYEGDIDDQWDDIINVTYDFWDAKAVLALKDRTPTPEEIFNLIAVVAILGGRQSKTSGSTSIGFEIDYSSHIYTAQNHFRKDGAIFRETDIERGFALITTAVQEGWIKINSKMPYHRNLWPPLCLSIVYDNVRLMEHLLDLGADTSPYQIIALFRPTLSAIQLAAGRSLSCLKALVARGVDVNYPPKQFGGTTALHETLRSGRISCLSYLLSEGADIHALETWDGVRFVSRSISGGPEPVSALEYAILEGRIDAVSLMLQAEPSCQPRALELARKRHKALLVQYIGAWTPDSHENTTIADVDMLSDD